MASTRPVTLRPVRAVAVLTCDICGATTRQPFVDDGATGGPHVQAWAAQHIKPRVVQTWTVADSMFVEAATADA